MDYKRLGIDLGVYSIKIVQLREIGDSFEKKCAKTYKVNKVKNEKEYYQFLKKCISDFIKTNKIKFASFCFTIPCNEPDTILRFVKMPVVDKKTLQKSLKYEIEEKEIVKDMDEIYYNWEIVPNPPDEPEREYNIVLSFIRKKLIKELAKLKTVHWQIENIELQPISVGRLVRGYSAVIDFGHSKTRIYLYKDGNLANVENLDTCGAFFNDMITKKFHFQNLDDIERLKHSSHVVSDFIEDSDEEIHIASEIMTNEVKNLFNSIKRLIRSFELHNSIVVEDIYYLGGTANMKYFIDDLSRELELNVKPLEILSPREGSDDDVELRNYTIASSAALYKKYKYFNDLNFSKNTKFQINLMPIIVGLFCASIIVHGGAYYVNDKYDQYISDLTQVQSEQRSAIETLTIDMQTADSTINSARTSIEAINGLLGQQKWLSDILYVLPDKVPKNTIISNIVSTSGTVILEGYTTNYSDIGFFAIALEGFGEVTVNTIKNDVTEEISPIEITDDKTSKEVTKSFIMTLKYNNARLDDSKIIEDVPVQEPEKPVITEEPEVPVEEPVIEEPTKEVIPDDSEIKNNSSGNEGNVSNPSNLPEVFGQGGGRPDEDTPAVKDIKKSADKQVPNETNKENVPTNNTG